MFNAKQNELMLKAVELLNGADALVQEALGASDECEQLSMTLTMAMEDMLEIIQENNPEELDA
jgi:hypothetical protein